MTCRFLIVLLLSVGALGQSISEGQAIRCFWYGGPAACGKVGPAPVLLPQLPDQIETPKHLQFPPGALFLMGDFTPEDMAQLPAVTRLDGSMDVPAIQETDREPTCHAQCSSDTHICMGMICEHFQHWTCADKSRILLTSEDGAKHCFKLN
jgi:hypothetical protein